MSPSTDILVLGATGFTGRLVTKHLNAHRHRASFTFALGARSRAKLDALVREFDLNAQIPLVIVDVTNPDDVERAVKSAKVVINTVGPYWKWGTPVVEACVRNGIHCVDITGETAWIKNLITKFDYAASKTHAVIVPSCGFDSLPSDFCVYLSVQKLKEHLGSGIRAANSVTGYDFKGGVSGGTLSSVYTYITEVPRRTASAAIRDHALSPAADGAPSPRFKLVYKLPHILPRVFGGFFLLYPSNRAVIQRTRGLLEVHPSMKHTTYGPEFNYEEFITTSNWFWGLCMSMCVYGTVLALHSSRICRWLFKRFLVDNVYGPSDEQMEKGSCTGINVTSSVATPGAPETHAKTVVKIQGDPGYLCTSMMLIECALALLDPSKLTPLAREGGILTPVTAFGGELVKRLEATQRFTFESSIIN